MMNESKNTIPDSQTIINANEVSLLELVIIVAKRKKLISIITLAAAIVSALISLSMPNLYKSNVKLLPPQQAQSGAAALLSQLGGVAGMAAGAAGLKNPNDLYVAMLKSRTIADQLIAQFDLKRVYDLEEQEKARKKLENNTVITSGKDGLITIEVEDKNQLLVARLANAYVTELLRLTKVLAVTEASQRRMFFERQLELSKDKLAAAEVTLKGGLDSHGVISVDSESRAIVETVARLRAQASAKEIELNSMRAFVTTNNPRFKLVEEELASLRLELSKLENGRSDDAEGLAKSGEKQNGFANIKLLRDLKYHQMLYELLAKQFEAARLDEAKDSSVIQVLDPAIDPEKKFKPLRALIVVISSVFAFLAAIVYVLIAEFRRRVLLSSKGAEQWCELMAQFRFR